MTELHPASRIVLRLLARPEADSGPNLALGPTISQSLAGTACEGVVSVSVRDTAALLASLSVPQPGDPYGAPPLPPDLAGSIARPPVGLRIALMLESPFDGTVTDEGFGGRNSAAARICEAMGLLCCRCACRWKARNSSRATAASGPTNCNRHHLRHYADAPCSVRCCHGSTHSSALVLGRVWRHPGPCSSLKRSATSTA